MRPYLVSNVLIVATVEFFKVPFNGDGFRKGFTGEVNPVYVLLVVSFEKHYVHELLGKFPTP